MQAPARLRVLSDERLAARMRRGDDRAFEVLFERHHGKLLSFCRYLLGNRHEAEDAVQQSFLRLHRALLREQAPQEVRPFLFAVARNRCKSVLAARGDQPAELDRDRPDLVGLAEEVQRREDLRQLVSDIGRLPEEQRAALVLAEMGDLRHGEIATILEVPEARVRALVFQAKDRLLGEREARERPCEGVREELATARGGDLRRAPLRRHLRSCPSCRAYQASLNRQRAALGALLPVAASPALQAAAGNLAAGTGVGGLLAPGAPSPVVTAVHAWMGQTAVPMVVAVAPPAVGGAAAAGTATGLLGGGLLSSLGGSVAVKAAVVVAVAGGTAGGTAVVGPSLPLGGGSAGPSAVAATPGAPAQDAPAVGEPGRPAAATDRPDVAPAEEPAAPQAGGAPAAAPASATPGEDVPAGHAPKPQDEPRDEPQEERRPHAAAGGGNAAQAHEANEARKAEAEAEAAAKAPDKPAKAPRAPEAEAAPATSPTASTSPSPSPGQAKEAGTPATGNGQKAAATEPAAAPAAAEPQAPTTDADPQARARAERGGGRP